MHTKLLFLRCKLLILFLCLISLLKLGSYWLLVGQAGRFVWTFLEWTLDNFFVKKYVIFNSNINFLIVLGTVARFPMYVLRMFHNVIQSWAGHFFTEHDRNQESDVFCQVPHIYVLRIAHQVCNPEVGKLDGNRTRLLIVSGPEWWLNKAWNSCCILWWFLPWPTNAAGAGVRKYKQVQTNETDTTDQQTNKLKR